MDTRTALGLLGVTADSLTPEQRRQLDEDGFFVVEDAFTPAECAAMAAEFDRLAAAEGENAGREVSLEPGSTRISDIFNKTTAFDGTLSQPAILAAAHHLLGEIKVHGANLREPHKGHGQQPLHSDVEGRHPGDWWVLNALILIDPLTLENGPTRIVPGSHKWPALNVPGENVDYGPREQRLGAAFDKAPADPFAPYPGEVHATGPAGAVVVTNSHLWHSGTRNRSGARRRMLHLSFTRRDLKQQLVQQDYLTPALYARLGEPLRWLMDVTEPTARIAAPDKDPVIWKMA